MFDSEHLSESFAQEMEKIAIGNIAGSAATLGVVGGALGAMSRYQRAKAEGDPHAGRAALGGALTYGAGGAALGAGLGGVSHALRGGGAPMTSAAMNTVPWHHSMDKSISDFGRRQVHSVSGYVPKGSTLPEYAEDIGIGGRNLAGGVEKSLAKQERVAGKVGDNPGWWGKRKLRKAQEGVDSARAGVPAALAQEQSVNTLREHGATSIPGTVSALADSNKRGPVVGAMGHQLWNAGGTLGKVMVGLGGLGVAKAALTDPKPGSAEEGQGRLERVGHEAGNMMGWAAAPIMPFVGQSMVGAGLSRAGGYAGRLIGGRPQVARPDPTRPEDSTARQVGPEMMRTQSADGKPYGAGVVQ